MFLTPPVVCLDMIPVQWHSEGVVMVLVALLAGGTLWYFYICKFRQELERVRQRQALEQERARIARDLHDDLGPALTQIKLLGELIERDAGQPASTARHARQISQNSRQLAQHMDELVWVANPQKDHLANLVSYLTALAEGLLETSSIRCRFDFPDEIPEVPLSGHLRHCLFLALKEALNNAVRHAQATEVNVRLRLTPRDLVFSVADNGQGFNPQLVTLNSQPVHGGNGLANMQARLSEVGGTCQVESRPGAGTKVELHVKLS
jgi:signal transduction histidine kinase